MSGLFFYAWGEPVYVVIMIFSSFIDYAAGLIIDKYDDNQKKANGGFAGFFDNKSGASWSFFKYSGFFAGIFGIEIKQLPLPIGISFYTFQSMSYTIDMYMRKIKVQRSFLNFATYVSLFPQIVAGPIVRYEDVQNEIDSRKKQIFFFWEKEQEFLFADFPKGIACK